MHFTFMYFDVRKETFDSNVQKLNNIDLYHVRVQTGHVFVNDVRSTSGADMRSKPYSNVREFNIPLIANIL